MANIDYRAAYFDAVINEAAPQCNGYPMLSDGQYKEALRYIFDNERKITGDFQSDVEWLRDSVSLW